MSSRLPYLLGAAFLVLISVGAIVVAQQREPGEVSGGPGVTASGAVLVADDIPVLEDVKTPPWPSDSTEIWWNTEPLEPSDFEGRVVLVDFWTYSCVNCIRTLPELRSWWDRYEDDGLLILGVHSPEFVFEQYPPNVEAAIERNEVTWPVVNDPGQVLFRGFGAQGWPQKMIVDGESRLRFNHIGEGEYEVTEEVIRALLGVDPDSPRADDTGVGEPTAVAAQTLEIYLGAQRGAESNGNDGEYRSIDNGSFAFPSAQLPDTAALDGRWDVGGESVTSVEAGSALALRFTASEVNLVLAPPVNSEGLVVVTLDGEPVPESQRGAGVSEDADGRTVVRVEVSDMVRLLQADEVLEGELGLTFETPGTSAFAFTFGS